MAEEMTSVSTPSGDLGVVRLLVGATVVVLMGNLVLNLGPIIGVPDGVNAVVTLLLGLIFTVVHGGLAWGWKRIAVFMGITIGLSFTSEAVGVATGLIFGSYHYTDLLGPKLLGVPLMIQVGYVSMGYASLITARAILGDLGTPQGWRIVGVALCGALLMSGWDVVMDPYQSTISGEWLWRDGGAYFGIPLHNYVGWFSTVFVFMLIYLLYESWNPLPAPAGPRASTLFWSEPVVYYALMALGLVITPVVDPAKPPIASPENYSGSLDAMQQSLSLLTIYVMGTPVIIALLRLGGRRK